MVLTVEFARFAEEARRHCPGRPAYLAGGPLGTVATVAEPRAQTLVRSVTPLALEEARTVLHDAGIETALGEWLPGAGAATVAVPRPVWVTAVAYVSGEDRPGLWMDASLDERSPGEILRALHEEFRREGALGDVTVEEFIRLAEPNVLSLSPEDAVRFAEAKTRASD